MKIETLKKAKIIREKVERYENLEYILTYAKEAIFEYKGQAFVLSPDDDELRDALLPTVKELVDKYRKEFEEL